MNADKIRRKYIIVIDNKVHNIFTNKYPFDYINTIEDDQLSELLNDHINESSKCLIINVKCKALSFQFKGFKIVQNLRSIDLYKFVIQHKTYRHISIPLCDVASSEIKEVLFQLADESLLLLYKKLCRFIDEFVDLYSQISDL